MKPDPIFNIPAIEQWGVNVGIFGWMNSQWGWPISEALHFIGLCMLMGAVGMFDLRVLGVAKGVPIAWLHRLVPVGVAGWLIAVATGFCFLVSAPSQYLHNPAFQSKMSLMALAGANMVVFYISGASAAVRATRPEEKAALWIKVFAFVSLAAWLGVIICGRVITYFRPPYFWCLWC
jgi:hypothetical protein